jgi:hypothetical protein
MSQYFHPATTKALVDPKGTAKTSLSRKQAPGAD